MIFAFVALPSADASSGVDVSASNIVAEVGGASSFTVRLSSAPSETVYVALITASGGVAGLTLGDASSPPAAGEPDRRVVLRFTSDNWNVAQTATVHALSAGATTVMVVRYDPSSLSTALVATVAVEIGPESQTLSEVFVASMVDAIQRTEQSVGDHPQFEAASAGGFEYSRLQAQSQQQRQLMGTSVVYVVDDSGSMDGDWPEVQTALKAVRDMTGVTNTKVALIAFGTVPTTLFGLTDHASAPWDTTLSGYTDHQTYLNSLTPITAFGGYKGGTFYVPALAAAQALLDADSAVTKKIVFMTDGQKDDPRDDDGAPNLTSIIVDTTYFGNHYTDNVDDLMTIATSTGGTHRAVAKPATGTTNSPAVTAQALDTILKAKALADTTTLYLYDVSFSMRLGRRITDGTRFHHMQLALSEVQKKVRGISNARVGLARFMGKNELTQTVTAELDGESVTIMLNQWLSPYSRRAAGYQSGAALVVGEAISFRGGTGSTDLDNALNEAYDDIVADSVASATKRVVLITDGITTNKPTTATIAKYNSTTAPVCLDVVAFGAHADRVYLKTLAEMVTCNSFAVASEPPP